MTSSGRFCVLLSAVIVTTLLGRAGAQSLLTGSAVHVDASPAKPLIFTSERPVNVIETSSDTFKTTGSLTSGRWTLQSDTAWATKDPHSQVSARGAYSAPGGFHVSAGLTGRSRYVMPLVVAQPLGANGVVPDYGGSFFEPVGHAMVWDSQIRIEKTLKDTGTVQIRAVGELFNLFDASTLFGGSRSKERDNGLAGPLLTSRSARFGLVVAF